MHLTQRFEEALAWAIRLHSSQYRKGTRIPYAAHILGVASIVIEHGGDEDDAIAALLHDAVEDQGGMVVLEEIRSRFGSNVASIVTACTDRAEDEKLPWRLRKERYLATMREASSSARLVSAADKLHNARSILNDYRTVGEVLWPRFSGGRDGVLWYYRALVGAYRMRSSSNLVDELDRTVSELERLVLERQCGWSAARPVS